MDAELKAYLDGMFEAITNQFGRLDQRLERLEGRMERLEGRMEHLEARMDGLEGRLDAMHLEFSERFIAVDERFRSMELRLGQFETRVIDRLERLEVASQALRAELGRTDRRVAALEQSVLELSTRVDVLSDDMRQRFRVLTEQIGELAA